MDNISDEVLMAFADGALPEVDHKRIAQRIANDKGLTARLQPFVVTRTALSELFGGATAGPIPERLLKTVREAPIATAARAARRERETGFVARAVETLRETLFPSGFALAHAFTVASLLAGGAAAGWLAANSSTGGRAGSDIAFTNGLMYAEGALAQTLERQPSARSTDTVVNGSMAPRLTFVANDHRFCRQYEMASEAGRHFSGFACRENGGAWQVVIHAETQGGMPGTGKAGHETAAGSGSPAVEAAIDKVVDGGQLERDAEAALIAKGWK